MATPSLGETAISPDQRFRMRLISDATQCVEPGKRSISIGSWSGAYTWKARNAGSSIAKAGRRAAAPITAERVGRPNLRPLRLILMPRSRFEIAQTFVFHLVELAVELHDLAVGVAMI